MAHVVRSFEPEVRIPENEAGLAGLYRTVLHEKRALLLMDNASGKAQVEPLIPPAGSLLLVTSRFHFVLPGMVPCNLDELANEDACALLRSIASRMGEKAEEIASLCGRLPLALRLAGSALTERFDLPVPEYICRLKEGKERFGEVDASLNLSYELLNEDSRRFWRMLAIFSGTFNIKAVAAIWELETDSTRDQLSALTRNSLVEWEDKESRYRLHDLVRKFTKSVLDHSEEKVIARRHAKHFLQILNEANWLYLQGGENSRSALKIFDSDWDNIQVGQKWAEANFISDSEATELCNRYPIVGAFILNIRQSPINWKKWTELGLEVAAKENDLVSQSHHLGNLGLIHAALGELKSAIGFYEKQLTLTREAGNRLNEGNALNNLGVVYMDLGEHGRAINLFEQRLAIAREIRDSRGECSSLNNKGMTLLRLGKFSEAIEFLEPSLELARRIGFQQSEGVTLGILGSCYRCQGNVNKAISSHLGQLGIMREIKDRRGEGYTLGSLGIDYVQSGDLLLAAEYLRGQLFIARELGDRLSQSRACWSLGIIDQRIGNFVQAIDLMQVYVDYEREIGHPDAEKDAAYVDSLRARLAAKDLSPEE
jgi:tetratricopeptide (TPR) repeat protein